MTLEDFFTFTEMNNGLTSPSRVKELISVLQKERDCTVKNAANCTSQRSVVASVIAATENKDCLDLFIQLDGLQFISNWLKDAQKLSNDSNNSSVEESITHLFGALEKLNLDHEKSVVLEIRTTVEILVDHKCSEIQDRARVLLESWETKKDCIDEDKARGFEGEKVRETSVTDNGHELTRDDQVVSTSSDAVRPEQVESAHESNNILDFSSQEKHVDRVSSSLSLPKDTVEPFSPASSRQGIPYTDSDFHDLKSKTSELQPLTSSSDAVVEMEDVIERSSQKNSNDGSKNPSDEDLSYVDSRAVYSDGKSDRVESPNAITPKGGGEKSWGKFLSGIKDYMSDEDLKNDYSIGKKQVDMDSNSTAKKSSGVEEDYGIVDPLEVAMQVAMEVEREIVDDYSPSPKRFSRSNTPQPKISASEKQSPVSKGATDSSTDSPTNKKNLNQHEIATSQITEAAQGDEPIIEKSPRSFIDLNEDIFMEDLDDHHHHPEIQFSAPVSVVSASRASAADPKLPCAPLQFEGNLGWRGSALTSAFRRVPESDFSTGGSSSSNSKQRQVGCLDFDLNVTESVDESSVETNSKRSEHLELDLNRMSGDGGSNLLDWRIGNDWSQSASSSQQHSRNFNLNNGSSFLNAKKANIKSDGDSTISIMGTRVEVNRKDIASQTPELAFDINSGRRGNVMGIGPAVNPYVHSPGYGYSNFPPGPTMPYSGPMYGPARPIPYMVDSRGMPVMGPPGFSPQPYVINMNGPMPSNGFGQPSGSVGLNSGMLMEGGSKDPTGLGLGLGLFMNSAQVRPMGEPSWQAAVGGRRKEPDTGYNEHYYPSKHYAPSPWK